jgi:hypothetical protein
VSSVINITMFGFFCAAAGVLATVTAASDANKPSQMVLLMIRSL